jgi:hypothetical protein
MSDNYKMKLRSSAKAKTNHVIKQEEEEIVSVRQYEQQSNNINGNNSNNSSNNDGRSSSPKTPPNVETDADSNIESYFPPSPYGRKRDQARGDR